MIGLHFAPGCHSSPGLKAWGFLAYFINVKNGQRSRITKAKNIHAFSLDASLIYRVESTRTRNPKEMHSTLFLLTQDGNEKEILKTTIGTRIGNLSLSPNKKWLRFRMREQTDQGTFLSWNIIPAEGGKILDVSKMFDNIGPILWGPHENGIIIRKHSDDPDTPELWYISNFLEHTTAKKLDLKDPSISFINVHPDGQNIAFRRSDSTYKYWVMENYLPPKKEK